MLEKQFVRQIGDIAQASQAQSEDVTVQNKQLQGLLNNHLKAKHDQEDRSSQI